MLAAGYSRVQAHQGRGPLTVRGVVVCGSSSLNVTCTFKIQSFSDHGRPLRVNESPGQRRLQRGDEHVRVAPTHSSLCPQVYKAYDLVELRTVALKIHELNSQWSEEKKV